MISKTLFFACAMHAAATTIVWYKSNAHRLFDINLHPITWWILTGWLLEMLYLNAWWKLSNDSCPWVAQITLAAVGTTVSLVWMSIFYGFETKYVISAALVFSGLIVSQIGN